MPSEATTAASNTPTKPGELGTATPMAVMPWSTSADVNGSMSRWKARNASQNENPLSPHTMNDHNSTLAKAGTERSTARPLNRWRDTLLTQAATLAGSSFAAMASTMPRDASGQRATSARKTSAAAKIAPAVAATLVRRTPPGSSTSLGNPGAA